MTRIYLYIYKENRLKMVTDIEENEINVTITLNSTEVVTSNDNMGASMQAGYGGGRGWCKLL